MQLTIDLPKKEVAVVRMAGKFTIEDVNDFKARCAQLAQAPVRHILINCKDLKYIDSSGIGALIVLTNTVKKLNIGMIFYNVDKDIIQVFKIAYLDKFFRLSTPEDLGKSFPGIPL